MHLIASAVLELGGRKIAESRVQPFLIIDAFQEFADAGVGVVEVAVFVAVNLLLFQRFHE